LGMVIAAGGAGWKIGQAFDKSFAAVYKFTQMLKGQAVEKGDMTLTGRLGTLYGGTADKGKRMSGTEEVRKRRLAMLEEQRGAGNAETIRAESGQLGLERGDQYDKRKLEMMKDVAAIEKQITESKTEVERVAYQERIALVRKYYEEDIKLMRDAEKEAERKKQEALAKPIQDKITALQEKAATAEKPALPTGSVQTDSMARTGGMFGNSRASLAVDAKALQVQQESRELLAQIAQLTREMTEITRQNRGEV
jgi:hypothetical protein